MFRLQRTGSNAPIVVRFVLVAGTLAAVAWVGLSSSLVQQTLVHRYCVLLGAIVRAVLDALNIDAQGTGTEIYLGAKQLHIATDCSGLDISAIVIAAIVAFPASLKQKLVGSAAITLGIAVINVIRIVVLAGLAANAYHDFETVHMVYAQGAMILLAIGLWIFWASNWSAYASSPPTPVHR